MPAYSGTYTDQYQLTMGQAYFLDGKGQAPAVFDYFFRKNPFQGGYVVFAGLQELLGVLADWRFNGKDLDFLREQGFHPDYLAYLKTFRFRGSLFAPREGDLVFPTRPVVRVEAALIEAQLIETVLLNILNFQSLVATKASRMRQVAGHRRLIDFGLRRAQGLGGYQASRAAIIGGFDATSNVLAGRDWDLPVAGTMAHSFIESFDDELSAFRRFAQDWPQNCVLLVDTYNTLHSGVPNAIIVAREMAARGQRLKGIRLDSGDLAYLAKRSRAMLDEAGFHDVKIAASNKLDEYVIKSLIDQQAPVDVFGVGTRLVTGQPDAALDGVYKLALVDGVPRIKMTENIAKITLPHRKQVFRVMDRDGGFMGADAVGLDGEPDLDRMHHPFEPFKSLSLKGHAKEPLLEPVMQNGAVTTDLYSVADVAKYCRHRLAMLPEEFKRFANPHIYKVGISGRLQQMRDALIARHKGHD